MQDFLYIVWTMDPVIFSIGGFSLRWYGLFFGMSFIFGYVLLKRMFEKEKIHLDQLEKLTMYMALGTFLGARLGHCFFYEPEVYLANPIEILKIWKGGLASHGAAIGIIISAWLYSRKVSKRSILWIMDRVVIGVALACVLIRCGNLMNSEIVGSETTASWGFIFQGVGAGDQEPPFLTGTWEDGDVILDFYPEDQSRDRTFSIYRSESQKMLGENIHTVTLESTLTPTLHTFFDAGNAGTPAYYALVEHGSSAVYHSRIYLTPRHPAQIYEAFAYGLIFILLLLLYKKMDGRIPYGLSFGIFLVLAFGYRFGIEFLKEVQVSSEIGDTLNIGQMLSVPFILAGIVLIAMAIKKPKYEG